MGNKLNKNQFMQKYKNKSILKNIVLILLVQFAWISFLTAQQSKSPILIKSWLTTASGEKRLDRQPDIYSCDSYNIPGDSSAIFVDDQIRYQTIDGFGAAGLRA
jgi:hypothetical protein